MRLLSPVQTKDNKEAENVREILRTQEIRKVSQKTREELANSQADFNLAMARFKQQWAKEEETHAQRVKKMLKEIEDLETRKAKALIPIETYKKQADTYLLEAKDILNKAKEKEEQAEDLNETLQDKLDQVGTKEQDLIQREKKLKVKELGVDLQQEQIREGIKKLNTQIQDFTLAQTQAEKDIDNRKVALVLWDRTLVAQAETQKRTEQSLSVWAIQLKEERGLLDKNWKELESKKLIHVEK